MIVNGGKGSDPAVRGVRTGAEQDAAVQEAEIGQVQTFGESGK